MKLSMTWYKLITFFHELFSYESTKKINEILFVHFSMRWNVLIEINYWKNANVTVYANKKKLCSPKKENKENFKQKIS